MTMATVAVPRRARHLVRQLRRGLSTAVDRYLRIVTVEEAAVDPPGGEFLEWIERRPFGWTGCWRVLRYLGPAVRVGAFVDIGCGVGRVVCAAARSGYKRVVGVELRSHLVAAGRQNIATLRAPHSPCEIVEADATAWAIPDDATVIFFYNPFRGHTLDNLIARIRESLDRVPRQVTIAYANPIDHQRIVVRHGLKPTVRIHVSWRPGKEWRRTQAVQFYKMVDDAGGSPGVAPTPRSGHGVL